MTIPILDLRRARQRIAPQLEERWQRILDDSSYILGPEVKEFEEAFADYLGVAGLRRRSPTAPTPWSSPCAPSTSSPATR